MKEKIAFLLSVLLAKSFLNPLPVLIEHWNHWSNDKFQVLTSRALKYQGNGIQFAAAKGVAGLGKAGGDGQGGSDKGGQQVPPEVYIALTYAGTAFLLTLSVPLILYGLNKLLNKIEDCFGCGPSSRREKQRQAEEVKKKRVLGLGQEEGEKEKEFVVQNNDNNNNNNNNNQTKPSPFDGQFTSINQQLHLHQQQEKQKEQQQDNNKFNQQLSLSTLTTNGNDFRANNNASNDFSEPIDNQRHHNQSNSLQTSGHPSPAQNGGTNSCVINFAPFEKDMNYTKTASGTSNSTVSNSSHRHPSLQAIQLQQQHRQQQQQHQQQQQQPFIISSPNM